MAEGYIQVLEPGLLTTVQDLGRFGYQRYGFAVAGAADLAALILGNRLVGNPPGAAALEITLVGPRLRFEREGWIAITGADLGAVLDGAPVPVGCALPVRPGSELAFRGGPRGCRAYLCVAGGIAVPPVLGSRSTDLQAGIGGLEGRPLRAGDRLPVGEPAGPPRAGQRLEWTFVPDVPFTVRFVPGPQEDFFPPGALARLCSSLYTVTPASDRVGLRLSGPPVPRPPGDVLSEGQPLGAIQVPPDGQPIVLLADRVTVGGYPKIGVVTTPDACLLAQVRPGDALRFAPVSVEEAQAAYRRWWQRLHGEEVFRPAGEEEGAAREPTRPVPRPGRVVAAPLAGIFHRRPGPGEPPFAERGQRVQAGQVVGLVEVMKTFFEVRAPCTGTVRAVLVEEETPVQAGQPLLELEEEEEDPRSGNGGDREG